jgi:hypothetical protein
MTSDIFTKNLPSSLFEYHGHKFYGQDEYYYESKNKKNGKKERLVPAHCDFFITRHRGER